MDFKLTWKEKTGKYSSGKQLFLGKFPVASYSWNSVDGNRTGLHYVANTKLPGIKSDLGKFATEEESMRKLVEVVKYWLNRINEDPID